MGDSGRTFVLKRMAMPMEHGPHARYIASGEEQLLPGEEVTVVEGSVAALEAEVESLQAENGSLRSALRRIRDHTAYPCSATEPLGCIDVMRQVARAALVPSSPEADTEGKR